MANRRMFSQDVTNSDEFLDMPLSSQALYFHLGINADDDGFVQPKRVMRMVEAKQDDLKVLSAKGFVIEFHNSVIVITHWKVNNQIRADRKKDTIYKEHLANLGLNDADIYQLQPNDNQVATKCPHSIGKDSIGEYRIGKVSKGKDRITSELSSQVKEIFNIFYKINPSINWGNKTSRSSAEFLIKKFGFDNTKKMAEQIVSVQGQPYCPTATTPYQMKEKLANFKIYFDSQKNKKTNNKLKIATISKEDWDAME